MSRTTRFSITLAFAALAVLAAGCYDPIVRVDAIYVSRDNMDFGRSNSPGFFEVANKVAELGDLEVTVTPGISWIEVLPTVVPCPPPQQGVRVERVVTVRINRAKIPVAGRNEGTITLSATGALPVTILVAAVQDSVGPALDPLNIINPVPSYSAPYLVEFAFSLRDQNDNPITGEPAQFQIAGYEDDTPVGNPEGLQLRRAAARQLWLEVVMDYSAFMMDIPNAISEMQRAITDELLPNLNEDALVAVSRFYRDEPAAQAELVVEYTVDRDYLVSEVDALQTSDFAGGAKLYEALMTAIESIDAIDTGLRDDRYIVLFCNGRDTSSLTVNADDVADAALAAGVRIIAVAFDDPFGADELNTLALRTGGRFFSASELEDLQDAFDRIIEDLQSQYVLRWASARQADGLALAPGFDITLNSQTASYTAPDLFQPSAHAGNRNMGELVLIQSSTPETAALFLRANYVPRGIRKIRLLVDSADDFSVTLVGAADDGLLAGWTLSETAEDDGRIAVTAEGPSAIPFAAFGPMLRFDFHTFGGEPFFEVDNSIYEEGRGFVIQ